MDELPLDAYYDLTQVTAVATAPGGDRVAFTATEYDPDEDEPVASLFVAPTDGSREPHRLTSVSGASAPAWSPDGDRLAFMAARDRDTEHRVGRDEDDREDGDGEEADEEPTEDGTGDDEPKSQVWAFDLALGGDARQLTDFDEGVRAFDWAPDGERLVVEARDPDEAEAAYLEGRRQDDDPVETERMQHKLDGVGYTDTVTAYLFVVGEDGELGETPEDAEAARRLDEAWGAGAFQELSGLEPDWGAGDRIAFVSARDQDDPDDTYATDVFTVAPDGSDLTRVTDGDVSANGPTFSPDGEHLVFGAGDPENWCVPDEAMVFDGDEIRSLTADLDRTLARGNAFEWADTETVYALVADEARTRAVRLDATGEDDAFERAFEAQGEHRALSSLSLGDGTAGLLFSDPQDGQNVWTVDEADLDAETEADADSLTQVSVVNPELTDEYEMPATTRVEWKNDGWDLSGVLYHPEGFDPDDPEEARPLVCAIHGGPLSYDEPVFSFDHAALVSRGYVVFRPNYRGGTSYGRQFAETLRGRWGTVEASDVAAGVRAMVDRGVADGDRLFGYGFSYGGIAQGYLVTQYPDLFTAAAPEHGIYDLRSAFGTDDSHVWMENDFGLPWEEPEDIDASSAITDAGNIETPLLVTAGAEDWRCPPSQSEQLYMAAKKNGVEARLVLYQNEHHNIGTPDRAVHRLEELTAWYRRHDPAVEDESATDPHGREADVDATTAEN